MRSRYDAVVIGSGPNGLAAGITLAQAGRSVLLIEAAKQIGGGAQSAELTLPGFTHDICSAVHPLGIASPFFRSLPLEKHGLSWIHPPACVAHPLDDGTAGLLELSLNRSADTLGKDSAAYLKLLSPWQSNWEALIEDVLGPLHIPKHPILLARFGFWAIQSAEGLIRRLFKGPQAQALFAGLAAHSFLPLSQPPSAAIGLILSITAHGLGWPIPKGGSQRLADALGRYFQSLGGEIVTGTPIHSHFEIPASQVVLFDLSPEQILKIGGTKLPGGYQKSLRAFKGGPGVFKMDWALSDRIPWKARECTEASTVHLGGTFEEVMLSEQSPGLDFPPEKPFLLVSQPSVFDSNRAPLGKHTVWAYCHVPRGSNFDMSQRMEAQIERFAPGFKERILAKKVMFPKDLEAHNANLSGGDISGGIADLKQLFFRPAPAKDPYRIPVKGWYICSASTPPGAGVHGMCGYHAAKSALKMDLS